MRRTSWPHAIGRRMRLRVRSAVPQMSLRHLVLRHRLLARWLLRHVLLVHLVLWRRLLVHWMLLCCLLYRRLLLR